MPIAIKLKEQGVQCTFVVYETRGNVARQKNVLMNSCADYPILWVNSESEAKALYLDEKPSWLIIANNFDGLVEIKAHTKTALVSHGIGPKACYYTVSDSAPSVRFVEGPYRTERLQKMYPQQTFIDTGYAKLDPIINGDMSGLKPSNWGLDNAKKTILYAPTFYPSSIECLPKDFARQFSEYNIILKPHYFSIQNPKYKSQRQLLQYWAKSQNVYLAGLD